MVYGFQAFEGVKEGDFISTAVKKQEISVDTKKEKAFSNIGLRSFVTVMIILSVILIISGALSYFVPQGSFQKDTDNNIIVGTYEKGEVEGIAI